MQVLLQLLILVAGFVLLIWGADFFVDGASRIADRLRIPQLVIGLTIVAFGTSAPEAAVSITAGLSQSADLAVSNVVGSNIMNIFLILGISCLVTPLVVQKSTAHIEIPIVIVSSAAVILLGALGGNIGFVDGIILWVGMIAFLIYLLRMAKKNHDKKEEAPKEEKKTSILWLLAKIIIGGVAIVVGSRLTVDSASTLATMANWEERIIGLTIVAFGTSLPELVTSVVAAFKKKADIAIGNVVGSNIFNVLFVLGTTALVTPGGVPFRSAFIIDCVMAVLAALILMLFVLRDLKLKRVGGMVMLGVYAVYFVYLIANPFQF